MSMPRWLRRVAAVPIYPLLAAAYPVVFLYAQNVHEAIAAEEVLLALGVSLGGALLTLAVLAAVTRGAARAALMTTWLVVLFFTYGFAYTSLVDALPDLGLSHGILLAVWAAVALIGIGVVAVLGDRVRALTTPLNGIGTILLVINLITIGGFALNLRSDPIDTTNPIAGAVPEPQHGSPDIYWLILDRYGSGSVLDEFYGDDNAAFLDALRDRGLYIADEATANYLKTGLSLVSSRNMEYLDGTALADRATSPEDWGPIYRDLSAPFTVEEFLGSQAYRFIYLGTAGFEPTARHPSAEISYVYTELRSEFLEILSRSTVLMALEDLGPDTPYDWRRNRWNQTRYEWDSLNHATSLGGPKFVHAHFSLPHDPFVFRTDGSFLTDGEEKARTREENYVDQVGYANAQVLDFVDRLLALPEAERPILIIQADEGPWPKGYRQNEKHFDWTAATEAELREKFGILSAFYLPNVDATEAGFYPSITPVNQFRAIFNAYWGLDLQLEPDRNYIFPDQEHLYELIDVTDRFRDAD